MNNSRPPARIYRPPRSTMTSGKGRTHGWVLEFVPAERQQPDPLMGWVGSGDTDRQVRLHFDTREEAGGYCRRHRICQQGEETEPPFFRAKIYAGTLRLGRPGKR